MSIQPLYAMPSIPIPSHISQALIDAFASFQEWGRLKPSAPEGNKIAALAIHQWSLGALPLVAIYPSTFAKPNAAKPYYYATTLKMPRADKLFIHWDQGWCNNNNQSWACFRRDTKQKVNSYSYELLSHDNLPKSKYDDIVQNLVKHLENSMGPLVWSDWLEEYRTIYKKLETTIYTAERSQLLSPTYSSDLNKYVIATAAVWHNDTIWPPHLTPEELVHYTVNDPMADRPTLKAFQDKIEAYIQHESPHFKWSEEHVAMYIEGVQGKTAAWNRNILKGIFDSQNTGWEEAPGTMVLSSWMEGLRSEIIELMHTSPQPEMHTDIALLLQGCSPIKQKTWSYSPYALGGLIPYDPDLAYAQETSEALNGSYGWRFLPRHVNANKYGKRPLFNEDNSLYSQSDQIHEAASRWLKTWNAEDAYTTLSILRSQPDWVHLPASILRAIGEKFLSEPMQEVWAMADYDETLLLNCLNPALPHESFTLPDQFQPN